MTKPTPGLVSVPRPPERQTARLADPPPPRRVQVTCQGDTLEVIKRDGFWGEGDVVLGPVGEGEGGVMPLGGVELVLDWQRQQQQQQQPLGEIEAASDSTADEHRR